MGATFGNRFRLTIFGESHGEAIGGVIDGLIPGHEIDFEDIAFQMKRRAPGMTSLSTPRKEKDEVKILSGALDGKTTGSPLAFMILNEDKKSKDYESIRFTPRPGHADYSAWVKYKGFNDYRGGGHFSGRITAPIVFAGTIAQQILKKSEIEVFTSITKIGNVESQKFKGSIKEIEKLKEIKASRLPSLEEGKSHLMEEEIKGARAAGDSVGGIVECIIYGIEAGIGEPFFDSLESHISRIMFSIPAVKGIEFGEGFNLAGMRGHDSNDELIVTSQKISHSTNNNGGILGGITNGMPIIFRVAIKPTPSISKTQSTVDLKKMKEVSINIEGRHDPCIVPRVLPVIESAAAIAILDMMMLK
ncbi:chorismate synthase [Acetoanaerobium pronyense]|uniref:Chorismate synthase n=1 Tax=Acetoanaerobium pronyense TaxID=1482736 RepID=A0ABS4KL18_9FIRM|nr:chorismate synthase [Acetoanaerobium pronyense]MBP2028445.1 chorismate synthase [Acetoanaerobium pronyense]